MGCGGSKLPSDKRPHSSFTGRKTPKDAFAKQSKKAKSLVSIRADVVEVLAPEVDDTTIQPVEPDFVISKANHVKDVRTDSIADDISELNLLPGEASQPKEETVVETKEDAVSTTVLEVKQVSKVDLTAPEISVTESTTGEAFSQSCEAAEDAVVENKVNETIAEPNIPEESPIAIHHSVKDLKLNLEEDAKLSTISFADDDIKSLPEDNDESGKDLQEFFDNHAEHEPEENVFETDHELSCAEDHTKTSPKIVVEAAEVIEEIEPQEIPDDVAPDPELASADDIPELLSETAVEPAIAQDDNELQIIPDGTIHEIESLNDIQVLPDSTDTDAERNESASDSTKDFVKSARVKDRNDSLISQEYKNAFPDGEPDGLTQGNITASEYRFICDEQAVLKEYNESLTELREMGSTDLAEIRNVKVRHKIPKSIDSGVDDLFISELAT